MSEQNKQAIPNSLTQLLKKVAKEKNFDNYELKINAMNSGGGNYMGDLYSIDVEEEGKETLHLFAKASNTPAKARVYIPARQVYEREVFAYTDLAEAFDALQTKHNIPEEDRFKFAKYYGADMTELEEVFLLENLSNEGYSMYDRCKSMDWEYATAAVEQLAKFHALSYALEIEEPERYDELIRSKKEFLMNRERPVDGGGGFKDFVDNLSKLALAALDPKYHAAVKRYCDNMERDLPKEYQALTEQSVLVHGDYRISNQMVKYKEGALSSLLTLDYQTIYHGSPINDLLYLLFTGSDAEFRRRHYDAYIQLYRDSLARALAALSHDIDTLYPHSLFLEHLRDKLLYGLGVALLLLPVVLVEASQAPKISDLVDEEKRATSLPRGNALYAARLSGIVEDLVRWGALDIST